MAQATSSLSSGVASLFEPTGGEGPDPGEGTAGADRTNPDEPPEGGTPPEGGEPDGSDGGTGDGTGDGTGEGGTGDETGTELDVDELMAQFAEEHGLDLNDPKQRKTAKRLADKEIFIQKQAAELKGLKKGPGAAGEEAEPDYLADFEKSLLGDAAPATDPTKQVVDPTKAAPPAATPAQPGYKLGDIGDEWKAAPEAYPGLNEAWSNGDWKKAAEIDDALSLRRSLEFHKHFTARYVKDEIEKALKEQLGGVREVTQERQNESARDEAFAHLRGIPRFAEVADKLLEVHDGDFVFEGKPYDNIPLNRIFAKYKGLLKIRVEDKDPAIALKKTTFARILEAAKIYEDLLQKNTVKAGETKTLVDQANQNAKRQHEQARVRQSLNAGAGATGLSTKKSKGHYVDELNSLSEEGPVPTSSLF